MTPRPRDPSASGDVVKEDGDSPIEEETGGIRPDQGEERAGSAEYLRKELYERMQTERGLFTWLQKAALDGIWYWDLTNPETEWMSPEFKELFGYTDEEIPNTSAWWQANIHKDDLKVALEHFNDHVTKGTPYDQVVRYRHKDGSTVWVRCRGKADLDENGVPIRMLGAHSDVTKLMKDLKEKETTLDLLCTTSLDGFWDRDLMKGTEMVSARWKKSMGYEEEEVDDSEALLHPEDVAKHQEAVRRHMEVGAPYSVVLRYMRKDNTWAHMLAQGVAQKNEKGEWTRMFGTHTDVSDLERARAEARSADAAKSTFLAAMSHEIRTPLNAVLGMAQVLMTTDLSREQHDCLSALHNSSAHLLSLLNDILDFSQIEAGHIDINTEVFDIQRTARDILDVMKEEAKKKKLALTFDTRVPVGSTFTGDSERIRQMIFNLLGNSVKFTKEGTVGIRLQPETRENESGVFIQVHDTGIGMNQEQKDLVFREFTQATSEIRKKYGGSGLGLSVCRKLARLCGGTLELESEKGVGSTFSIWLPGLVLPAAKKFDSAATQGAVLVVDPRPENLRTIADTLAVSGITVKVAKDTLHLPLGGGDPDKQPDQQQDSFTAVVVVSEDIPPQVDHQVGKILHHNKNARLVTVGRPGPLCKRIPKPIELPLFPTSDELVSALTVQTETTKQAQKVDPTVHDEKSVRVLLAEDNLINQKVMVKILSRFPWKVELKIAGNGEEAAKLAARLDFDCILMDIQMPLCDGLGSTRIIRESGNTTPIIALTASASTNSRDLCYDAGMDRFLTKPVRMDELRLCIEDLVFVSGK